MHVTKPAAVLVALFLSMVVSMVPLAPAGAQTAQGQAAPHQSVPAAGAPAAPAAGNARRWNPSCRRSPRPPPHLLPPRPKRPSRWCCRPIP